MSHADALGGAITAYLGIVLVRRISSASARSQHPTLMFLVRKYPDAPERIGEVAAT